MPRPKAQGSLARNQLQLAIALSTSLEESKTRELSKMAEELPADAIEEGAIPHDIKQMQKEFLERLKPPAAVPSKRQRKTTKTSVPVLYSRSSEERMRIITEKVALILIKESNVEFYEISEATCRKLFLKFNKETRLWNMAHLSPPLEERNMYYIDRLSDFISPLNGTSSVKPKNRLPLPGRFLTPNKRGPNTPADTYHSQEAQKMSDTQNWSNIPQFSSGDLSDQEAQLEFQSDWLAMLDNPVMSDITVFTNQQGQIAAHKLVIYARYPIILNDLDISGFLRWDNINYNDALAFLKFIYSGQLAASLNLTQNAKGVVLLARKYKVLDLLKHIFTSDTDLYETDVSINKGSPKAITNYIHPNELTIMKSDKIINVLDHIEISSDDSMPSEKTPERIKIVMKRTKDSPTPGSPSESDNSKRKLVDESTPRKLVSKKLCMEISDEEEVPSPFKCTMLDSSNYNASVPNPSTPPRESCDDGTNDFQELFNFAASQFPNDEHETLSQTLGSDALLHPGRASTENSPLIIQPIDSSLKSPKSSTGVPPQDYKIFLEDSFNFDLKTPPHPQHECATPQRTPLADVKTSSPATPMPDYSTMTNQQLEAELCRFGLKRSLPRNKGIKMLKHIYGKLHPLVEVVVRGGRELFVPIGDKTPIHSAGDHAPKPLQLKVPKLDDIMESPNDEQSLSQSSSSDESDVMEESIFDDEDNSVYEGLTDLKTKIQVWITSNADLYEKVLRYEPIWLESIHKELKEYTQQNIKLSHLMEILDEEGITFRMAQKSSEGSRRRKKSPKKKPIMEKKLPVLKSISLPKRNC